MIDLHIHLLPAIDDGPADLSTSLAMLDLAADLGYTRLVATPHLLGPLDDAYDSLRRTLIGELLPHATTRGQSIVGGYEVRLTPDIGRRLRSGEPISLGQSKAVLVELPFSGWPNFTEHALLDVLAAGFTPLLAHPERYQAAIDEPSRIIDLHSQGVLMQVTTGSLAGLFGKRSQALAEHLLRLGVVDVLASDAHSDGRRFVSVTDGLAHAVRLVGRDQVKQLTWDNPQAILSGATLSPGRVEVHCGNGSVRPKPWQLVRNMLLGR